MSVDDFLTFRKRLERAGREDIASAAQTVFDWVGKHPTAEYVEAEDVLGTFKGIDPLAVSRALALMSETGLMKMKYAVSPRTSHTRLEQLFELVREIPGELYDWKQVKFEKDDAEVYPVFVPAWV